MKRFTATLSILAVLCFFTPFPAKAATTYNINCSTDANLHLPPIVTCSGADFVYTGSDYWYTNDKILTGAGATQWYVSYTLSSSVNMRVGDLASSNDITYLGSQTNAVIGLGSKEEFLMYKPAAGGVTVSDLCITDTSGACEGGGAPAFNFWQFWDF